MKSLGLWLLIFSNLAITLPSHAEGLSSLSDRASQVQSRLEFLVNKKSTVEGPNCWNQATFVAGISKGLHHTSFNEFGFILDSPLCKQVTMEQAELGDIVAFRRFDRSGRLLVASFLSEIHGYSYVDSKMGFTKNGVMVEARYEMMSHEAIYQFYRKSEYNNCKMFGFDRGDCNMKALVYRCQTIESFLSAKNELSLQERELLAQIGQLELQMQQMVLSGGPLPVDAENSIADLNKRIEELESAGSADFLLEYMKFRMDSIVQTQSP
ncbi:hypothetical protein D3C87_1322520 [compost metagenome]